MSKSLLDLMSEDERKKAIERADKRMQRNKSRKGLDVSPEIFLVAEMGYYFGWEGLMAVRRGYTINPITNDEEIFTLAEAQVLLEGARKVWYTKLTEQAHAGMISNSFNIRSTSFESAVQPFTEKAEVKE